MIISLDSTEHDASQWSHSGHTWKLGSTYVIYRLPNLKVTTPPPGSTKGNLGNGFCTSFYVRSTDTQRHCLLLVRYMHWTHSDMERGPPEAKRPYMIKIHLPAPSAGRLILLCGPQTLSVSSELQRWKESIEDRINHCYGTRDRSVLRRYLQDR